jgi:type I restriction enzyme, S subunit
MTSSRFKPYPFYKDSGIKWLGQIPAHWDERRVDAVTVMEGEQVLPADLGVEEVFHYSIPVVQQTGDGRVELVSDIASAKLALAGSELLVSKLNPRKGNVLLAESHSLPTVCSGEYVPLRIRKPETTCRRFLLYLYLSQFARQSISSVVQSATRSHQRATPDVIRKLWVALPSRSEQVAIANFLDRETGKIDALLEKKERLIELLQEKRTALITHAVTKGLPAAKAAQAGLDPNVPMKDSGVEWLGQIPEHWEHCALKRLGMIRYGLGEPPLEDPDGIPFVRATDLHRGRIHLSGIKCVDPGDVPWSRDPVLRENDVIVVRSGAYTGDSAIVPRELDGAIAGYDVFVRIIDGEPRFVAWALLSTYVLESQIDLLKLRAAQPHLNVEELGDALVLTCSRSEQQSIADFLDHETAKIDTMIAKVGEAIERLKEYRTALISAAVTGKIDVRGVEK